MNWEARPRRALFSGAAEGALPPTSAAPSLQLSSGPYRTTVVGIEIVRQSTKQEWQTYGEALRKLDEAKQWAIGDWLVDGKSHYGDGLYQEAARVLSIPDTSLRNMKSLADRFELSRRHDNLSYGHHYEVASLKILATDKKGKLQRTDEHDMEKAQELLAKAEKEGWSVRDGTIYEDIALERWSDLERERPGWVVKPLLCDYIAYAIVPLGICYLLPVVQLQAVWKIHETEWMKRKPIDAPNSTWITRSFPVEPGELFGAITEMLCIDFTPTEEKL